MKDSDPTEHSPDVESVARVADPAAGLDVTSIHAAHADFVWATLQRFGVRDADLEDAMQETFVVVHRRLDTWDRTSKITTWLFGVAMRVAAAFRRKAHVRRERATEDVGTLDADPSLSPEDLAARREARETLDAILDTLDLERRAVFVMFEIEEMSCDQIANAIGIPTGTVYSRLHKARKEFAAAMERHRSDGDAKEGSAR
jgi:RNA polymerase sigma-70 factor (ECF subfamily)